MSNIRQFVDQLAAGDSSAAKETLEGVLGNKSFEALDAYKKEIASSIFKTGDESESVDNSETV